MTRRIGLGRGKGGAGRRRPFLRERTSIFKGPETKYNRKIQDRLGGFQPQLAP